MTFHHPSGQNGAMDSDRPEVIELVSDVAAAVAHLAAGEVRARIEEQISARVQNARAALARVALAPRGRMLLDCAIDALTERDH